MYQKVEAYANMTSTMEFEHEAVDVNAKKKRHWMLWSSDSEDNGANIK